MQLTRTHYLIGGLIILILIVLAAIFGLGSHQPAQAPQSSATTTAATSTFATTTTQISSSTMQVTGQSGGYTITKIPLGNSSKAPSYKAVIKCPSDFSKEACASMASTDAQIVTTLNKNPEDWSSWIELGTLRKQAGDYKGAEMAWTYVIQIHPNDPVAYNNLSDLYVNYLKENAAAETILKQGIAANPKAINLQIDLARLYKSLGETSQANAEYDAAIKNAQAQGQTQLAQQIQTEKSGQ